MEFEVSSEVRDAVVIVRARGEVDLATAHLLDEGIAEAWTPPVPLIIDALEVGFMDSTGLGVLVKAVQRTRIEGGTVAIAVSADRVRKVLAITGLDTFVSVHGSVDEAVRATKTG